MTARRRVAFVGIAALVLASRAQAQTQTMKVAASTEDRGYVEVVAQSAFGNVTSQSYGVEAGGTVWQGLQIFGEVGNVRNVATPEISAAAQLIASALADVQPAAVTFSVKQPVTFFGGGIRYLIKVQGSSVRPYVAGGFGVAQVSNEVAFQLGGVDAAGTLAQYVTIGSDLSGDVTKPMLTLGGGVVWPWQHLVVDVRYRYGRIFTDVDGINVSRAGVGIGLRF